MRGLSPNWLLGTETLHLYIRRRLISMAHTIDALIPNWHEILDSSNNGMMGSNMTELFPILEQLVADRNIKGIQEFYQKVCTDTIDANDDRDPFFHKFLMQFCNMMPCYGLKEERQEPRTFSDGTALASGTVHADGTVDDTPPLYPSQETLDFMKRSKQWEMKMELIANNTYGILSPLHEIKQNTANMISNTSNMNNVNNKNVQQPVTVHQQFNITMPNVTESTTATELMNDLQSISRKKYQINW